LVELRQHGEGKRGGFVLGFSRVAENIPEKIVKRV
jgi:hypothetical protein